MSRRRPPREARWVPGTVDVAVVCTGRGTHAEVPFGSMAVLPSGSTNERLKVGEFVVGADLEAGATLKTIPFVCRRCRPARNVPLRRANLDRLCLGIAAAGDTRLDLSALGQIDL